MKTRNLQRPRKATARISLPHSGNIAQFELPNGIRVYVYENFASPAVIVNGYVLAGSYDEAREQAGLAGFVTDCLMRGTRNQSYEQIFEQIESIGANLSISGSVLTTSFFSKSLAEDLPAQLTLLGDALMHPTFPADEIEKERAEWLTGLQERSNSPRAMAGMAFYELAYPTQHPYHYSNDGYPETARALTRDAMVDFHRRHFAPGGAHIVIVGAIKAEDARTQVERVFGGWSATRPARTTTERAPGVRGDQRKHIAMPGKSQTSVLLGYPGASQLDSDWVSCSLMNSILGQFGMYGRLGEHVRKEEGLVYYIGSRFEGGTMPGPWLISAGTNPNSVDRVIEIARAEMCRMRDRNVRAEELEDNKRYFTGVLPLQMETNEGIAGQIVNMLRYRRPLDHLLSYSERINAVTVADIRAAARKWLDPDNFVLVTAGS